MEGYFESETEYESGQSPDPYKKAKPEAEAYIVISKERQGVYYILLDKGVRHPAWFISHTSILNLLEKDVIITWQPEAFISFASTICDLTDAESAKQAFERIVLGLAQSGMQLLDDETIGRVFGGVIEQARLNMNQLKDEYDEILKNKYGEPIESVVARIPTPYVPLAITQISAEITQREIELRKAAQAELIVKDKAIAKLEKDLKPLERYRSKQEKRQNRKRKSKKPNKKKKK